MRMKTWAGLGLAGVLMVVASTKADEPPKTYSTPSYVDVATYFEQPVPETGPAPLGKQAFIFEAESGQLRLKPHGIEKVAGAVPIHVPPQGVTIEAGPKNTVIVHVEHGNGDSSRYSAVRALLILPDNPGLANAARADEPTGWLAEYRKQVHQAPKEHTLAEYAEAAVEGKTREQLDEMVEELTKKVNKDRAQLQIVEATLKRLKETSDGEPVRREFGVSSLHGGKQLYRNVGVGQAVPKPTDAAGNDLVPAPMPPSPAEQAAYDQRQMERRLTKVEQTLVRLVKALEDQKGR